jgi:hypothetical protein
MTVIPLHDDPEQDTFLCAECGHDHYLGAGNWEACRVCSFDGASGCPKDPKDTGQPPGDVWGW